MPVFQILLLTFLTEISLILIGSLMAWIFGVPVWSKFIITSDGIVFGLAGGAILAAIGIMIVQSPLSWFAQLRHDTRQVSELLGKLGIFSLLLVSIMAGVCEEFLFRGVLQVIATDWIGPVAAILLSAFIFGLIHPMSLSYIFYVSIFGSVIGWIYFKTDDLFMVMMIHAVYDFIILVWVLKFNRSHF